MKTLAYHCPLPFPIVGVSPQAPSKLSLFLFRPCNRFAHPYLYELEQFSPSAELLDKPCVQVSPLLELQHPNSGYGWNQFFGNPILTFFPCPNFSPLFFPCQMYRPLPETPCHFVSTLDKLVELNEKLMGCKEFALDLEVRAG